MPTAQQPRGHNLELSLKSQADFKTAATGNYARTMAYSWSVAEDRPDEDDPIVGHAKHNTRDATEPAPGLATMGGQVVVPLDFSHLGWWLHMLLGAPVTTGENPDYVHTFESGKVVLPEYTAERKLARDSGSIFIQQRGLMANGMTLRVVRESGFARATVDLLGYGEFKLGASGAGTPSAIAARAPIAAALGVYKIDTVQASILECSLAYNNGLAPREEPGDDRVGGFDVGVAALTGSLRLRLRNMDLYDDAVDGTLHAGEILFQKSAARSLSWQMPAVKLQRSGVSIEGPGFIDQTFNLRAHQTDAAPMLTAVLKSAVASF